MTEDSRDIEVKIMNAYCAASEILRQFEGKYKLRNYRGPIESVVVQCDGDFFSITVGIHVLDVETKRPVRLTVNKAYPQYMLERDGGGTKRFFESCLREAFRWTHNHELDEAFVCDGKFVNDPHPESRAFTPPTLNFPPQSIQGEFVNS
jgi:hypothetical protein